MGRIGLTLHRRRLLDIELSIEWLLATALIVLYIFYLVSPAISLYLWRDLSIGLGRQVEEIAFALFATLILLAIVRSGRLYVGVYHFWFLVFLALGILSTILGSVSPNVALLGFLQTTRPLIVFLFFYSIVISRENADRLLRGIDIFFIVLPVIAVLYMLVFEMALGYNFVPAIRDELPIRLGIVVRRSIFPHTNQLGSMMVFVAVYHFAAYVVKGEWRRLIYLGLAAFAILMTVRMKPMFAMPFSLVLIYLLHRVQGGKVTRRALITGVVLLVTTVVVILALAFFTPLYDLIVDRLDPNTSSVRTILLRSALILNLESYGLGVGYGRFGSPASAATYYSTLFERFGLDQLPHATAEDPSHLTDQWWAWYLGEIGIIGTAVFLIIIFHIAWSLYKRALFWQHGRQAVSVLAYTAIGVLAYGLATGYAGTFLTGSPTTYYVMSLVGLPFALHRAYLREREPETLPHSALES